LEAEHLGGEGVCRQGYRLTLLEFLADLVILAEHAAEVAPDEEDRAGASRTGNGGFFAEVQTGVGNLRIGGDPAEAGLAFETIDPAKAWAALAMCQLIGESLNHNRADYTILCVRAYSR
jgi:hypothetical protein